MQSLRVRHGFAGKLDVSHELDFVAFAAGDDDGFLDRFVGAQAGIDLFQFDAIAPDFDLVIDAAEEFQVAIGEEADPISRTV